MTPEGTIRKATELIDEGRRAFAHGDSVVPAHFSKIEYFVVYQQAIDLLLQEGFIACTVPALQEAFVRLIPPPKEYADEAQTFDDLHSDDPARRIKAASRFDKLARAEASLFRQFLFQYPETFSRLIPAVRDSEPRVVECAIRALGFASERYFRDPRVFEALLPLYTEATGRVLLSVVVATGHVSDSRKYDLVLHHLDHKPSQPLLSALCCHFSEEVPAEYLSRAQPPLLRTLDRKLNPQTRSTVLRALAKTVTAETLASFKALARLDGNRRLAAELRKSVHTGCSRDRIAWLERELLGSS